MGGIMAKGAPGCHRFRDERGQTVGRFLCYDSAPRMPAFVDACVSALRRGLPRVGKWVTRHWAAWIVIAVASYLVWPAPLGTMPMSQDHTVHLARAWMFGQTLSDGHVSQWSSYWYFGFPLGDLYPVLGDIGCALVRALSLGKLSWAACYGIVFWLAYVVQGLAMLRAARGFGLGPLPGIVAALLIYLDPGVLREGGWSYTVHYGVWLQPMCCALLWWAFAEIAPLCNKDVPVDARKLVLPSVLFGLAMLAHPVALPVLAMATPLFVLHMGLRRALDRVLVVAGAPMVLGVGLAAWWVLPLIANSAWMANFGTLYSDLPTMLGRLPRGAWAKHMGTAIGYAIFAGLLWAWIRGPRFAKFVATLAIVSWLTSSSDFFFRFRLDWLSENFRYLQYQRFIIMAKPGLYLCAGAVLAAFGRWGLEAWRSDAPRNRRILNTSWRLAVTITGLAVVLGTAYSAAKQHKVGKIRLNRLSSGSPTDTKFEKEWQAFGTWATAKWDGREEFFRFAYKAKRHSHALADAPVVTGAPAYKIGFTPGEVFIHKLESEQSSVLDRLRVRYLVGTTLPKGLKVIKKFGRIKVAERKVTEEVARLVGEGEIEVVEDEPDTGRVVVNVSNAEEGARLEFNIAGYPRWELLHDGVPVDWYEVPAVGSSKIATQADRKAGKMRAGQGAMPSPRDPMLIAIDATDGTYELRYRHWMRADILGFVLFLISGGVLVFAIARRRQSDGLVARIVSSLKPWVVATLVAIVVTALGVRYAAGFMSEWSLASGWLRVGRADDVDGMTNGPLKVDRVISPAVLVTAEEDEPAHAVFPNVQPTAETVEGWIAVDDGGKEPRGTYNFVVGGRAAGSNEEFTQLFTVAVRKSAGKQDVSIPLGELADAGPIDLEITIKGKGAKSPRMGFELQL